LLKTRPVFIGHQTSRVQFTTARVLGSDNNNNNNNNNNNAERVIDLSKDTKRQEIGFEQETVLDSGWKPIKVDFNKLGTFYSKLSKRNLTALVVSTTMMGCVMAPLPFDPYMLTKVTLGTMLTSMSANTINQVNLN